MNYVPIHGLRMLAVESCILIAAFLIGLLGLRFLPPASRPKWLERDTRRKFAVRCCLSLRLHSLGRALLLPFIGIPGTSHQRRIQLFADG